MKKIVEARADGQVLAVALIELRGLFPWSRAAIESDFIYEAYEDFWWRRIDLPADVQMLVRDPRPGDPTE